MCVCVCVCGGGGGVIVSVKCDGNRRLPVFLYLQYQLRVGRLSTHGVTIFDLRMRIYDK